MEIRVVNSSGSYDTIYYYHNGVLVSKNETFTGESNFYHPDHLGSTTLVTDSNGKISEETEYNHFGALIFGGEERFGYTGKEKDKESSLQYYGARYYNPSLGIFVEPDSMIPDVYNPQYLNRYTYVLNNPYKYVDPDGYKPGQPFSLDGFFLSDFTGVPYPVIEGFHEFAIDISNQYKSSPISKVVSVGLSVSQVKSGYQVVEWGVKEGVYQATKNGNVMPIGESEITQSRENALSGASSIALTIAGVTSSDTIIKTLSWADTFFGATIDMNLFDVSVDFANRLQNDKNYQEEEDEF